MSNSKSKTTLDNALMGLQDARSKRGIMARGTNVYNGVSPAAVGRRLKSPPNFSGQAVAGGPTGVGPDGVQSTAPNFKNEVRVKSAVAANRAAGNMTGANPMGGSLRAAAARKLKGV